MSECVIDGDGNLARGVNLTARIAAVLAAFLAIIGAYDVRAENRDCTPAEKEAANKLLFLNAKDKKASVARHLPWGVPVSQSQGPRLLAHWDYAIGYSDTFRLPVWTANRIEPKGLNTVPGRVECFRQDPRINSPVASLPSDYDESDFDQGHLVPSEDLSHKVPENVNSFVMSNMTPQYGPFNRNIWRRLENQARNWAKAFKGVYVVSGSVFDHDGDGKPDPEGGIRRMKARSGSSRVAIPSHFYKIIVRQCGDGRLSSIAFMLPNEKESRTGDAGEAFLEKSIVSIASIEAVTGLEFFTDATAAGKIDRQRAHGMWPLKPAQGGASSLACGDT